MKSSRVLLALLVSTSLLVGCGGKSNPTSGKVLFKGTEPCAGALVVFHPKFDTSLNAPKPSGKVGDDGSFSLTTDPTRPGDGAVPGDYAVTVSWPVVAAVDLSKGIGSGEGKAGPADRLGGRYANEKTTPLTATIKSGRNELAPFVVN